MIVVCVGDCGVDRYLPSSELRPGGITSNFARQARRCFPASDEIHVISATGSDGARAATARGVLMGQAGIECHIEELEGNTPIQLIEIEADGEKNFVGYDEGVLRQFRPGKQYEKLLASAGLIVTPVFRQIHGLFDSVMSFPRRGTAAVDFADFAVHPDFEHMSRYIDRIDVAFFGLKPEQQEIIQHIEMLARSVDCTIVVTLGAGGSVAFAGSSSFRCPALPVAEVRDTTGAGDAFAAAFLARRRSYGSIQESLEAGAALAALSVAQLGAVPDQNTA